MPDLLPSINAWAQTVTAAGLHAAVQGALGLLAVLVLCAAVPGLNPSLRCWLWRLAFARLVIALFWSAPVGVPQMQPAVTSPEPVYRVGAPSPTTPAPVAGPEALPPAALHPLPIALALLWLAGASWVAVTGVRHLKAARRLIRSSVPVKNEWVLRCWGQLVRDFGLRCAPDLREAPWLESPMLLQLNRPTVVLPTGLADHWEPEQIRLMLAHELAHVRRHDLLWGWLPAAAHLLFYFHPLVWLGNREWRLAHDMAADALALQITRAPAADYARILLRAAAAPAAAHAGLALMDARDTARTVERRLTAMKKLVTTTRRDALLGSLLTLALTGAVLVPIRVVAQPPAEREVETQTTREPRAAPTPEPEDADRSVKVREAERSDPAAGARVATPRTRDTRQPERSDDMYMRRIYLDYRGVVPSDSERLKFTADRDPNKRRLLEDRLTKTDDRQLQKLEQRLRSLEKELQRAAELNRKLEDERRMLERELRALRSGDRVEVDERRREYVGPSAERRYLEERDARSRNMRRNDYGQLERDIFRRDEYRGQGNRAEPPVQRRPDSDPNNYRSIDPPGRGNRVEPPADRRPDADPNKYRSIDPPGRRNRTEPPADRRPGSDRSNVRPEDPLGGGSRNEPLSDRRPGSDRSNVPATGTGRRDQPAGDPAVRGGSTRELSLRMLTAAPDGERVLSTTRARLVPGQWLVFETPTGRQIARAEDARGEVLELRVEEGQTEGEFIVATRKSDGTIHKVLSLRPGRAARINRSRGRDGQVVEIEITVAPATRR